MSTRLFSDRNTASLWIPAIRSAITVTPLIYIPSSTVLFCRAPGPEHLQVAHGDVSVSEGGAAADDLAGLPAGGGGELPEQGTSTALAPPTLLMEQSCILKRPLSCLLLAPGSHVAAVRYQNNRGHSVCGGVRQAHRRLHGAVSE